MERAMEFITPDSFYVEANKEIYQAALRLNHRHEPIDSMTVLNELQKTGKIELIGGAYYLVELTKDVVSAANIESHARIIQQKFIRRELIRIAGVISLNAYDDTVDEFDLLEAAEKAVLEIGQQNTPGGYIGMDTALMKAVEKIEKNRLQDSAITGVPSGFEGLDIVTRGWQPGNLIILAARPAVGKSAMAMNLVRNAALNPLRPVPVAVWSLEMDYLELVLRMLAAESNVWLHKLQTGRLTEVDVKKIYDVGVLTLTRANVFFDDSPEVTIASFRAKARRLKKKHDIGLIVVDYLQLMNGEKTKGSTREQEVSNISRSMKNLAKELQVPIIALSQLSREIEKRSDPKPQLSDLRESGAIEQDADLVLFLWSPTEGQIAEGIDTETKRFIRIAKHRNGELTTEELDFEKDIQLFKYAPKSNWKPIPREPVKSHYEPEKDLPF